MTVVLRLERVHMAVIACPPLDTLLVLLLYLFK